MAGQVPLNNAKFINSPDFDNQPVSGITGNGVFKQFTYLNGASNSRTLQSSDVWKIIELTGNGIVTIAQNISSNIGDEIIIVNTTGNIAFSTAGGVTLLSPTLNVIPAERPARLVYTGSNTWLLAGPRTAYSAINPSDCCSNAVATFYSLGGFSTDNIAYADANGLSLYNSSNIGGVILVSGDAYSISNGVISASSCDLVNFTQDYTLYTPGGGASTLYSYITVNIFNDAEIIGVPFKTTSTEGVYPCDTSSLPTAGTYYRISDEYGILSSPICINSAGIITSANACS
jgi:hypothetical protein